MDFGFPRQFGAVFCKDKTMEVETVTTVELARKEAFRKLEKCCFCINLRLGLNIWLGVESILWLFLFISALYFEIIYVNEVDLLNFIDETNDWYFLLIFGDRFYSLDQKIRTFIILINFMLMLAFLTYLIFTLILIYGINWFKTCCFIPYFVIDAIFVLLAVCGCVIGLAASATHLFRVSFIFLAIKLYIELCAVSLFKEYREKPWKGKVVEQSEASSIASEENGPTEV